MAITGISSIDNKQIIAAGALSAISANQALITSGGDSLQGLYDTVSTNSASWTGGGGGSYPRDITADSILLSAEVTPGDSDLARVDISPYDIVFSHPEQGYGTVDATTVQNWDSTYETVSTNSASWTGGGGGSVPDEVMSAASAVSANSANWNEISAYQQNSGSYLTEIGGDISVDSVTLTGGSKQFETLESITGDSELKGVTISPDGITLRNDIEGNQDVNVTEVAKWNETTDTLSSNSAAWGGSALPMSAGDGIDLNIVNNTLVISSTVTGGGSNDAFYIYPGTTTDKEISENSAKDMRLYNTANNTYLDYAGKTTYPTYAILDFKNLSGVGSNTNTVEHVRVRVYPTATSACSIYTTGSVSLLASTSTVNTASTAYYDSDGNYLATTRNELTALSSFIQDNSGSWTGGGGGGGSTNGLIYKQTADYYGNSAVYLSGSGDVVFRVYAPNGISTITIDYPYSYTQDTVYFSPDYDYQNWYTALYTVTGYASPNLNVQDASNWEISAGDMRITNPSNAGFDVGTGSFNVNSTAYLTTGNIERYVTQQGYFQTMTSWYDNLSDYQMTGAAGLDYYSIHMNGDQYGGGYNWEVTIQSLGGGGPTVTSADVFPPTTGLTPGMTYTLKWNDSYGLYWDMGN